MSKQRKDQQGQSQSRPGEPDMEREAPRANAQHQQSSQQRPQQGSHSGSPGQPGSPQPGSQPRSGQQHQEDSRKPQHGSHDKPREPQHDPSMNRDTHSRDRNPDKF